MQQQKKLEIVIPFERMQRTLATLRQRFPQLQVETRSSFFIILSCYLANWTELDKLWLVDMKETGVIREFRCKERDDIKRERLVYRQPLSLLPRKQAGGICTLHGG